MTDLTVAETIVRQMGGAKRLRLMVGAEQFLGSADRVQFKFKGSRKANSCVVILDPNDTYTMQLWRIRGPRAKAGKMLDLKFEESRLYCDMLVSTFEGETGLYLSL